MTFYDEQLQNLQQQVARKAHLETVLRDLYNQKKALDIKKNGTAPLAMP